MVIIFCEETVPAVIVSDIVEEHSHYEVEFVVPEDHNDRGDSGLDQQTAIVGEVELGLLRRVDFLGFHSVSFVEFQRVGNGFEKGFVGLFILGHDHAEVEVEVVHDVPVGLGAVLLGVDLLY